MSEEKDFRPGRVFAVVQGNYFPLEVHALYETQELAERKLRQEFDSGCQVVVMLVHKEDKGG